jgi:hypothetical protein
MVLAKIVEVEIAQSRGAGRDSSCRWKIFCASALRITDRAPALDQAARGFA